MNNNHKKTMRLTIIPVLVLALVASCTCEAKVRKHSGRRGRSLAQVEAQVLKAYKTNDYEKILDALSQFEKVIKNNPQSMDYSFEKLDDAHVVDIEQSSDGKVRYYQWDHNGGTMTCYTVWRQYRNAAGKVVTENAVSGIEGECGGRHEFVAQLNASNGATVYVERISGKADSFTGGNSLNAYTIGKQGIAPVKFIKNGKDVTDEVDVTYDNSPGWYFRTGGHDGDGWDWVMSIDEKNQDAYVSLTDEIPMDGRDLQQLSDRYDVYHFDGKQFVYKHTGAGYWLHNSVADYKYLIVMGEIGKYLVRIDRMSDGTYRYASWNEDAEMSSKPALVIKGGKIDQDKATYTFVNGDYTYLIVTDDYSEKFKTLTITKGGRTIYNTTNKD